MRRFPALPYIILDYCVKWKFDIFQVKYLMEVGKYDRFLKSDLYNDAVKAESKRKPFPLFQETIPECTEEEKMVISNNKTDYWSRKFVYFQIINFFILFEG